MKLKLTIDLGIQIISFGSPFDPNIRSSMALSTKHEINRIIVQLHDTDDSLDCNETDSNATTDENTNAEIESKLAEVDNIIDAQKDRLRELIYKYRDIFKKAPGRFQSFEYKLEFQDEKPYFYKSYPIPLKHLEKVDLEIERMLKYDIMERSRNQYINPIVSVSICDKKSGAVRLCLDARELNVLLKYDHDGLEGMDEILRKCAKVKFMTSLDLMASFWQVSLSCASPQYTAFLHRGMTYQHKVMFFGTNVSNAALMRASECVLTGLSDFIIDFVDDWLCISENFEDH